MMMAKEISKQLSQRAEDVACYLLPNGKREGNEWCVGSIAGEAGKSLRVHLVGEKAGVWCDFANESDKGDLLDLWALKRNLKISEAIKEAAHYLGISEPHFESHKISNFLKPLLKNTSQLSQTSLIMQYLTNERRLSTENYSRL